MSRTSPLVSHSTNATTVACAFVKLREYLHLGIERERMPVIVDVRLARWFSCKA